jgi:hypothetical protein
VIRYVTSKFISTILYGLTQNLKVFLSVNIWLYSLFDATLSNVISDILPVCSVEISQFVCLDVLRICNKISEIVNDSAQMVVI